VLRRNPPCLPSRSIVPESRSSKESIPHWTHNIGERVHPEEPSVTTLSRLIFAFRWVSEILDPHGLTSSMGHGASATKANAPSLDGSSSSRHTYCGLSPATVDAQVGRWLIREWICRWDCLVSESDALSLAAAR
jgi:hypothetical protein